jgi:type I restriction enzyme S subunit
VDWETVPFCQCDEPAKYHLADGDIVFARTGATTGKSYLVQNPPEAVFASYLIRIRPGERVLPEYAWWYVQSSAYWHSVFSGIDDGNRPNMNGTKLAALHIPFPKEKVEQRRIVACLDALAAKQAELRRLQTETEAELAAFARAPQQKPFAASCEPRRNGSCLRASR